MRLNYTFFMLKNIKLKHSKPDKPIKNFRWLQNCIKNVHTLYLI